MDIRKPEVANFPQVVEGLKSQKYLLPFVTLNGKLKWLGGIYPARIEKAIEELGVQPRKPSGLEKLAWRLADLFGY
ncbi:MAG: hypothetical protein ACM3TT_11565 [Syntrophothermus sp.]